MAASGRLQGRKCRSQFAFRRMTFVALLSPFFLRLDDDDKFLLSSFFHSSLSTQPPLCSPSSSSSFFFLFVFILSISRVVIIISSLFVILFRLISYFTIVIFVLFRLFFPFVRTSRPLLAPAFQIRFQPRSRLHPSAVPSPRLNK